MKTCVRVSLCALAVLIFGGAAVHAQNITTVAGGGPPAVASSITATSASVGAAAAVRKDSLGNTYILDNFLSRVYKVDTTGKLTVFAGTGVTGFSGDGGPAVNASMNEPSGMCIDSSNNLFVADSDNAVIRVVPAVTMNLMNPTRTLSPGNIYTFAGVQTSNNPQYGGDGASALSAHLHFPDGCSFDSKGNLYIADRGNNEIRVIIGTSGLAPVGIPAATTPGFIYRFAGANDGAFPNPPTGGFDVNGTPAATAKIYGPFDVFVDSHDNVFFADLGNNFPPAGPNKDLTIPFNNNIIREIPATAQTFPFAMTAGDIYTVAGVQGLTGVGHTTSTGTTPVAATAALLNQPIGISVDAAGNLFFADSVNQVIREVPATTANGMTAGDIYDVAGIFGHVGFSGDGVATAVSLNSPQGTTLDGTGNLFIADEVNDRVRLVVPAAGDYATGALTTFAGNGLTSFSNEAPATAGQLNAVAGVAVDGAGNLAIAEVGTAIDDVSIIRGVAAPIASGALSVLAGRTAFNGFSNTAPFVVNNAVGVTYDSANNLYIADTQNCIVRKISAGVISTVAGVEPLIPDPINHPDTSTPQCGFTAQGGAAVLTKLGVTKVINNKNVTFGVNGVALDGNGNLFFSDAGNNVIWEVPKTTVGTLAAGNAYIVAGTPNPTGSFGGEGGPATAAALNNPTGIFFDVFGNLFIADTGNNIIREVPANNSATLNAGSIYTVAGDNLNHAAGYTNEGGVAVGAELNAPFTVVVDHAANIFIADTNNHIIREVAGPTPGAGMTTGHIYSVAGTPQTAGFSGDLGLAKSARLNSPEGLAIEGNGDLLVGDSTNHRVRSVTGIANVAAVAVASFDHTSLTFLPQSLNIASTPQSVTLTNTGSATLTGIVITFTGTNLAEFTAAPASTCGATLAAAASCTISVTFTPTSVTPPNRSATLNVADSALGSPQRISLSGTAQTGIPVGVLTPTPLTFATGQLVGVASAPQVITLSNATGTAPLAFSAAITNANITGANAAEFTQTNNCGTSVAIGASCAINVTFTPTSVTPPARTATLTVTDNAASSPQTVILNGTAIAPGIGLNPTSLTFASQTAGTSSAAQAVTVTNTGTAALSFTGVTIAGPNAADFSLAPASTCTAAVAPAATCTISVTYKPAAAGTSTATVMIVDNVTGGTQTIALSGTATPAALTLNLGAASGGSTTQTVAAGQTATYSLQITANQNASVTFTCSGAPTAATCSVPSTAVAVTAGTPAAVTVTVTTTARGTLIPQFYPTTRMQPPAAVQMLPVSVLAVLFLIVAMLATTQSPAGRLRVARIALSVCLVLMPIAAATVLVGCGGGSSSPTAPPPATGTPAGTSTITVTATSGSQTATTKLTLVVQ
jgi:hypothetical protein